MPVRQYLNDLPIQRQRLFRSPTPWLGGGLSVHSEGSGVGATFILELPRDRTPGLQKAA